HLIDLHSFPTRRSSDLACRQGDYRITTCQLVGCAVRGAEDRPRSAATLQGTGGWTAHRWHGSTGEVPKGSLSARVGETRRQSPSDRKSTRLNSSHVEIS